MEGYAKIAARVATYPELGLYRRFAALNAQNLLYLQAEIHELESDLHQIAQEDARSTGDVPEKLYSRDWHKLANSVDHDRRQWNTMCQIRAKLKEYNECLIQQAMVSNNYSLPRHYNLETLRSCLNDATLPDYLLGLDSKIWDDPDCQKDLIALQSSERDDALTIWIASNLIGPFHQLLGRFFVRPNSEFPGMFDYSDRAIARTSSLVATVLSSVLPIVGVIILYFVKDTLAQIGIISGMTALFSLTLALITTAKKSEIFAATAAFSAVLVVFLGSPQPSNG